MKFYRTLSVLAVVALLLSLSALAAPGAAWAQGNPTVTFKSPAPNATVTGPDVTITYDSSPDVTIVAAANARQLTEGHYHLFLDKAANLQDNVPILTGDPTIIHTAAKEYKWANVAPGRHTVVLVLAYSNHAPWIPRATATLNFTVAAPLPKTGADQSPDFVLIAGALLSAAILAFALSRTLRRTR